MTKNNKAIDYGKINLKELINGVGTITDGLGEVFKGIKNIPPESREDAIELLDLSGKVQDANQKLCLKIKEIQDRGESEDDISGLDAFTGGGVK